jgi:hypothetical protein
MGWFAVALLRDLGREARGVVITTDMGWDAGVLAILVIFISGGEGRIFYQYSGDLLSMRLILAVLTGSTIAADGVIWQCTECEYGQELHVVLVVREVCSTRDSRVL